MRNLILVLLNLIILDLFGSVFPPNLKQIDSFEQFLGGSTGAELVKYKGEFFVLKQGMLPEHLKSEFSANCVYRALGVPTPEAKLYYNENGSPQGILVRYIRGSTLREYIRSADSEKDLEKIFRRIGRYFVIDCLLGNWDVAGLDYRNILIDPNGKVWRIDQGAGFDFRAQGERKGSAWNDEVAELQSMRNPWINAPSAKIFGHISNRNIKEQIGEVLEKADILFDALPAEQLDMMHRRLETLRLKYIDLE